MRYPYRTRRTRRGGACLSRLVALVALVIIGAALYAGFVRPRVGAYIAQRVSHVEQPGEVQSQIEGQINQGLPAAIAALPPGEVSVTSEQANAFIANRAGEMDLIDSASVRFVPGEVQADVQALGVQSRVSAGLVAQDGRVVVTNPRIDGPLAMAVSAESLVKTLERQINDQLAQKGQVVRAVRIEQDRVVIVTE